MQRYSHSGIVPVSGAVTTVLAGVVAAIVGGVIYAFLAWWLRWGPVRLFLMIGYALWVGLGIGITANRAKIRSPLFNTVVALVCIVLGLWVYWGAYDVARNGVGVAERAWTPQGLRAQAADLYANGSFSMKGNGKVTGAPLVLFWIGEGAFVAGLILVLARMDANRPFCEACQEWTDSTSGLMYLAADGQEPAWQEVLGGDLTAIASFAPTRADASPHVRLDLASCPKCLHSNYITLSMVTVKRGKNGKTKTTQRRIVVNGQISDPEAEFLRQFAGQFQDDEEDDDSDEQDDKVSDEEDGETSSEGSSDQPDHT